MAARRERPERPLPHAMYVWPRQWTDPVREAIVRHAPAVDSFLVLGAEIAWTDSGPELIRIPIDHAALAATGRRVGLVLRIGPYGGPFDAEDDTTARIIAIAASLRDDARAHAIEPAEIQLDFDCASSKLDGYRAWVSALRTHLSPTPVTITTLPTWLGERGFRALVEETDGYVLQVHSLEKPRSLSELGTICDPDRSIGWVRRARRLGVPFRVALPTYGYRVAFDDDGAFIGLAAEGPTPAWPVGTRVVELRSDPAAIAALVTALRHEPPAPLTGLAWFRLPVATDTQNWPAETWEVVRRGEVPRAEFTVRTRDEASDRGSLIELDLHNEGTFDAPFDGNIHVTWSGDPPLASDAVGGFVRERRSPTSLLFSPLPESMEDRLLPGRTRSVGWLRFAAETEVTVEIVPPGS